MAWLVKLSEFEIRYEPRTAIKTQALVDFLVKMVDKCSREEVPKYTLHVDRASNPRDAGFELY